MCRQHITASYGIAYDDYTAVGALARTLVSKSGIMMTMLVDTEEFSIKMALFGMVWLLRVRAEMRRCAKCRREEMQQKQQQQQQHQQQQQQQQQQQKQESLQSSEDHMSASSAATFYTLDTPGPGGTYCEVHGYVPPKEGKFIIFLFSYKFLHYIPNTLLLHKTVFTISLILRMSTY